jgi:enolase
MPKITRVHAREILDSRGKPTVEAEVHLEGGIIGRASVPSGASTGTAEACELRDGDPAQEEPSKLYLPSGVRAEADYIRYDGQGVRKAVENVRMRIAPRVIGLDPIEQSRIDLLLLELDGTPRRTRLGANAILSVSLASARAGALAQGVPLYRHLNALINREAAIQGVVAHHTPRMPLPMVNMISGGAHANRNLDFQDILIVPRGAPDYPTSLEWLVRVYRKLGSGLAARGFEGYLVGDEGGYGPRLKSNRQAIEFVVRAIAAAQLEAGREMTLAIDVAANQFYKRSGKYALRLERCELSAAEMVETLAALAGDFPITSIEDGLAENDWDGWKELTARLGNRVQLVGDDLFATNEKLLQRGIDEKVANAVLIKVNQIGTLTETMRTMLLARQHKYTCIVSARSGETEDDFLADLAVGTAAEYIKIGSVARSERLAKYNRLLRIAEEI